MHQPCVLVPRRWHHGYACLERRLRAVGSLPVIGEVVDHLLDPHRYRRAAARLPSASGARMNKTRYRHRSRRSRPSNAPDWYRKVEMRSRCSSGTGGMSFGAIAAGRSHLPRKRADGFFWDCLRHRRWGRRFDASDFEGRCRLAGQAPTVGALFAAGASGLHRFGGRQVGDSPSREFPCCSAFLPTAWTAVPLPAGEGRLSFLTRVESKRHTVLQQVIGGVPGQGQRNEGRECRRRIEFLLHHPAPKLYCSVGETPGPGAVSSWWTAQVFSGTPARAGGRGRA